MNRFRDTMKEALTNAGNRRSFPSAPVAGGFATTNNAQLISARSGEPRQWIVTLAPFTKTGSPVIPWLSPWDGTNQAPITGNVPMFPSVAYRCAMRWGAGGIACNAIFDYPLAGGSFGVVADNLDLNVFDPVVGATVYASLAEVPLFGAFMVPGVSSGQPCRFQDVTSINRIDGESTYYAVKPYARRVWVSQTNPTFVGSTFLVRFGDGAGVDAWATYAARDGVSEPQPIPVPSGATMMKITGGPGVGGAGQTFRPLWEMFFS